MRRYTPPTCTLEIWAKQSPLSRWLDRPLLKEVRFALHFDDPRLPEESQITLRGDRLQLELLCDIVATYIQNFLNQSATRLSLDTESLLSLVPVIGESAEQGLTEQGARPTLLPSPDGSASTDSSHLSPSPPTLKPKGLVMHELCFGSLAGASSPSEIALSVTQLFDLANALEEYSSETALLPALSPTVRQPTFLVWAGRTASVLVAGGLTAAGLQYLYSFNQASESVASRQNLPTQPNTSKILEVLPPVPPAPTGKPIPSPSLPPSLAVQKTLTPPSRVTPPTAVRTPIAPLPRVVSPPTPPQVFAIAPDGNSANSPSRDRLSTPPAAPSLKESSQIAKAPQLPNLPSLAPQPAPARSAFRQRGMADGTNSAESNLNSAAPPSQGRTATPQETSLLLDTIPQVAEVRRYFQQNWKVPEGLNQRLEYRLTLNPDGSLGRITPLGRAASIYLDRTNMPLLGEPFVSPLTLAEPQTIRLVLTPDGAVRTFLEE